MNTDNTQGGAEPSLASAGSQGLSEAEVDALEYVVVEGRIACMEDYGILRSLLIKLRPEWEANHDAAPAARATEPESSVPLGSGVAPANIVRDGPMRTRRISGGSAVRFIPEMMTFPMPENTPSQENERQRSAAPSAASRGSQPVAWWVTLPGRDFPYLSHIQDRALFCQEEEPGSEVVSLYRQPQPTLTDEEREALKTVLRRVREDYFAGRFADSVEIAAVIDGLLERTT